MRLVADQLQVIEIVLVNMWSRRTVKRWGAKARLVGDCSQSAFPGIVQPCPSSRAAAASTFVIASAGCGRA
jgi:hypothetical protein